MMDETEHNTITLPGYRQFDENEEIPHIEATTVRIRLEFKNKLKSLTQRANKEQEYCPDCTTLPPTRDPTQSKVNIRHTSTNIFLGGPRPHIRRSTIKDEDEEVDERKLSTESTEYFKSHYHLSSRNPNKKRIPHDEYSNVMAAFTNLHVAHEIAINRCFRLKKPDDNDLPNPDTKAKIKEVVWDLVADEIESQGHHCPASMNMLADLKDSLISLMMPHNHELREQVHQILDLERIGKELSDGNPLDYENYLGYALDVLGQLCCPSRDKEVEEVRQIKEPLLLFQAIFKLVENMKLDMENFFINLYRPAIIRMTIENERKKFADFLELEYRLHEDGLRATRAWLLRHRVGVRDSQTVIAKAYGEILYWTTNELWPETLLEDLERFQGFRKSLERIGVIGGVILEVGKVFHKIFKKPPPSLRTVFGRYIKLLLPPEETANEKKLKKCLENAAEKTVAATQKIIAKNLKRSMTPEEITQIKESILKVADPQNSFRNLIIRRAVDYAEEVILAAHEYHAAVPSTLTSVMYEVAYLVNGFHRVVLHNRHCFEEIYRDIIDDNSKPPLFPEDNDWNWDNGLLQTLKKLRCKITSPQEAEQLEREFSHYRLKQFCEADPNDEVCLSRTDLRLQEEVNNLEVVARKTTSFAKDVGDEDDQQVRKPKYDMRQGSIHGYAEKLGQQEETEEDEMGVTVVEERRRLSSVADDARLKAEQNCFKNFCLDCIECYTTVEPVLLRP